MNIYTKDPTQKQGTADKKISLNCNSIPHSWMCNSKNTIAQIKWYIIFFKKKENRKHSMHADNVKRNSVLDGWTMLIAFQYIVIAMPNGVITM